MIDAFFSCGCSARLTTTMGEMRQIVELARKADPSGKMIAMVGRAPVTQTFCEQIGADCYTEDAASAANQALLYCSGAYTGCYLLKYMRVMRKDTV